jgi:hypothetical protein
MARSYRSYEGQREGLAASACYTHTTRCPARVMRLVLGRIKFDALMYIIDPGFHPSSRPTRELDHRLSWYYLTTMTINSSPDPDKGFATTPNHQYSISSDKLMGCSAVLLCHTRYPLLSTWKAEKIALLQAGNCVPVITYT